MMKLLFFNWRDITHPQAGGAELYLHEIGKGLGQRHRVTLYCGSYPGCRRSEHIDGIEIVRRGGRFTLYLRAALDYLLRLRREGFDVVVDNINGVPFFTPLFVRRPRVAVIHHLVGWPIFRKELPLPLATIAWLAERGIPLLYRRAPVVAVSPSTRDQLVALDMPGERIDIVYNATGMERAGPAVKSPRPLVAYVGRIKRYKQLDHLLRAFAIVRRQIAEAELVIAGRGDLQAELCDLVDVSALGPGITICGEVSEAEKAEIMRRAWVFVTPSMKEGWGITVLEANAFGTPVIAYDVPGLRDSIRNRETGLLVRPAGDIERLADGIVELLSDDALRQRLGGNAVEWAATFSWARSTRDFEKVLDRAIREKARAPSALWGHDAAMQ